MPFLSVRRLPARAFRIYCRLWPCFMLGLGRTKLLVQQRTEIFGRLVPCVIFYSGKVLIILDVLAVVVRVVCYPPLFFSLSLDYALSLVFNACLLPTRYDGGGEEGGQMVDSHRFMWERFRLTDVGARMGSDGKHAATG